MRLPLVSLLPLIRPGGWCSIWPPEAAATGCCSTRLGGRAVDRDAALSRSPARCAVRRSTETARWRSADYDGIVVTNYLTAAAAGMAAPSRPAAS